MPQFKGTAGNLVDFLQRLARPFARIKAHYRVKRTKFEFANGRNHINGIENFASHYVSCNCKQKGLCEV